MKSTPWFVQATLQRALRGLAAAALLGVSGAALAPTIASSGLASPSPNLTHEVQRALAAAGQGVTAADVTGVSIPANASTGITVATDHGQAVTLGLPAVGVGRSVGPLTL